VLEPASAPDLEAARRLRELCPELPIVRVSVLPPFPEVLELRPAAYLIKPFTIAGLRTTVESVLNTSPRGFRLSRPGPKPSGPRSSAPRPAC
jgi:hypothetical protein